MQLAGVPVKASGVAAALDFLANPEAGQHGATTQARVRAV
jgi:hypothetical protein